MAARWRVDWMAALAASLVLHAIGLTLLQRRPPAAAVAPPSVWRVQLRSAAPSPTPPAPPGTPAPRPAPEPRPSPPPAKPALEQPTSAPAPHAEVQSPAPQIPTPPPAEVPPAPESPAQPAAEAPRWIDASFVDQPPIPLENDWRLAELPWPPAFASVFVRLWIGSDGRIERFELQGDAADNADLQRLFAPFAQTPMQPARIGAVRVPSTMLIQVWPGDGSAPDFVLPLPPAPLPGGTVPAPR